MNKIHLALIISCFLFLSGCFKEDFSRYPSVFIPQYTEVDYSNLLSNKNFDVVYNSIVILGQHAEEMGEKLSNEKVDKKSAEYIVALNTYKKIAGQLNSSDTRVIAASLRFLQLFSNKYKMKAELVKPALQIQNNNPQVLFEKVILLSALVNKDSNIPESVVRKFLNNRLWIVSRSAYLLINSLEHDQLRQELINKYHKTRDEKEKLLILSSLEKQFSDSVATFLFKEALSTTNRKIRYAIFDMLGNSKNQELVLAWIGEKWDRIIVSDREYLFQQHIDTMDEKFSSRLLSIFLKKGFVADEQFLEKLSNNLRSYKIKKDFSDLDKEKLNDLLLVESSLLTNKLLAEKWENLKEKTRAFNTQLTQLQNEFDVIAKEYTAKLEELFQKNNIPGEKKQKYIEDILSSRDNLRALLVEDKPILNKTNDNK